MQIEKFAELFFNLALENRCCEISCHNPGEANFSIHVTITSGEQYQLWGVVYQIYNCLEKQFGSAEWKLALKAETNKYFERWNKAMPRYEKIDGVWVEQPRDMN